MCFFCFGHQPHSNGKPAQLRPMTFLLAKEVSPTHIDLAGLELSKTSLFPLSIFPIFSNTCGPLVRQHVSRLSPLQANCKASPLLRTGTGETPEEEMEIILEQHDLFVDCREQTLICKGQKEAEGGFYRYLL